MPRPTAADLPDRGAGLSPAQGHRDLLVGELARLHPPVLHRPRIRGLWDLSLAQNEGPGGLISGEESLYGFKLSHSRRFQETL